jgi:pyruvate carboxylase subunit B
VRYHVTVLGRAWTVDVEGGRVVVDGEAFDAHAAAIPDTPLLHLLLGGASWTIAAEALEGAAGGGTPGAARWALGLAGERYVVEVVDQRTREIQALTGRKPTGDGGGVLKAPMPGLVVRVLVEPGQVVAAGQGLVIVEAMKMENELRAGRAGRVQGVAVRAGQAVEKGAVLVSLEPVASPEPSG